MSKVDHKGEIWRKQGPIGWLKIVRDLTPDGVDYDGGCPGFSVRYGNYSITLKRPVFRKTVFISCRNYDEFVEKNHKECRHLTGPDFDNHVIKSPLFKPVEFPSNNGGA